MRSPYTVMTLGRCGVWNTDTTTGSLRYARERLLYLTRSPRRPVPARILDVDGRPVP